MGGARTWEGLVEGDMMASLTRPGGVLGRTLCMCVCVCVCVCVEACYKRDMLCAAQGPLPRLLMCNRIVCDMQSSTPVSYAIIVLSYQENSNM